MTTQDSGNTSPSSAKIEWKGRAFQFTIHKLETFDGITEEFKNLKSCRYMIACMETCPTTGKQHIHLYVNMSMPYRLKKKIIEYGAHIEICKGSPKQNIEYVRKDGNIIFEWGDEPHQGTSYTVKEMREMKTPDELDWRQVNTWMKLKSMPQKIKKSEWSKKIEVYYIWGESGSGKSTTAESMADDEFELVKYNDGFWHGVNDGEGCAIYDDFRDSHMKASEFINFIDYRIQIMNVKGGSKQNKYNKIIITSIQNPQEIYRKMPEETKAQWLRRMKIIHIENDTPI